MIMIIKKLKKINKSLVKKKLAKIQDSHKNLYLIFKAFEKKILQIEIVYNK